MSLDFAQDLKFFSNRVRAFAMLYKKSCFFKIADSEVPA